MKPFKVFILVLLISAIISFLISVMFAFEPVIMFTTCIALIFIGGYYIGIKQVRQGIMMNSHKVFISGVNLLGLCTLLIVGLCIFAIAG